MRNTKRTIFITGATSFVGANLVRRLIADKFNNVHIATREGSNKWRLTKYLSKIYEHKVDLRERVRLSKIIKKISPDIIFHLATQGIYGGDHLPHKEVIETNLLGTINLIDACDCLDYSCFINTGSSSEYGKKDASMKETDVCCPDNVYGITKNASTQYGQLVAKAKNKPIISLRLFSPYGPFDSRDKLIAAAIVNAIENKDLNLTNPETARDYIFIEDVLDVYLKAIDKAENFKGEIFNVGSGRQTKISEVIENIMQITGSKSRIKWGAYKSRAYDTQNWVANIEKTKKLLGCSPKYNLRKGLEETVNWFKTYLNSRDISKYFYNPRE